MRTEAIVWTPLPNGHAGPGHLKLSIFVSPQLQTDEAADPSLELFADFVNWPATVARGGGITFEVTIGAHPAVLVAPDLHVLSGDDWTEVFPDPSLVGVKSYVADDYSTTPIHSFSVGNVKNLVQNLYGTLGTASLRPPVLTTGAYGFMPPSGNTNAATALAWLKNLATCAREGYEANLPPGVYGTGVPGGPAGTTVGAGLPGAAADRCAPFSNDLGAARAFHVRPAPKLGENRQPVVVQPPVPILDFHKTVSSFGEYPAVLRMFGLVFDLVVPLQGVLPGLADVTVTPHFVSSFDGSGGRSTVNVSMTTRCLLSQAVFRLAPAGPKDYWNGMLDLADTTRFSVNDLDTDGAAEQLWNASQALQNIESFTGLKDADGNSTGQTEPGKTMAMTAPALRTTAPQIVWSGWGGTGSGLSALAARQHALSQAISSWVSWKLNGGAEPALPVLLAEDVIRGHRFDVLTLSEAVPRWYSLHRRLGRYVFGTRAPVALPAGPGPRGEDEGTTVPGATAAADTEVTPTPDDLWVHEGIVSWHGWSLAAPRPGPQIDPSDKVHDQRMTAPSSATDPGTGYTNAQFAANFTVPRGTLPKLRYGNRYRYRARAVDLAGNSLPPGSLDASTATPPATHLRYEPVASPVLAETSPLGPGEATWLMAILDYQIPAPATNTVAPNGRWLFPPRASQILVEEHGMLDGFHLGAHPDRNRPPSGDTTTYDLLAGGGATNQSVDGTLADAGFSQDPNHHDAFYLPMGSDPKTPWLPDPLSSGASLDFGSLVPAVHRWHGMPWPGADPLLLRLEQGPAVGQSFAPATASQPATETVTLPPADVLDVAVSSAITDPRTLGVFWWLEAKVSAPFAKLVLLLAAERGQLWMLSPYRTLRCVHAVRLPLVAPRFREPVVERQYGWTFADIIDRVFLYDAKSSADVDCQASWTDLVDDPSDPANVPGVSRTTTTGHAFKVSVPDPSPLGADDKPMQVFSARTEFPLSAGPGVQHNIGDTRHHLVEYTCTATSRFAEFFTATAQVTLSGTTPHQLDQLGLDPARTIVHDTVLGTTLEEGADYVVDPVAGTLALTGGSSSAGHLLDVTYVPADAATGAPFPIHVLSTVQPKPPKVVRVSPAWYGHDNGGTPYGSGNLVYQRDGGWVRVYLDRPWYSSGDDELLGVVALGASQLSGSSGLPADVSTAWVTTMGLDPISVSSLDVAFPIVPQGFAGTATVPDPTPWRQPYPSPPVLPLVENGSAPGSSSVQIWPYEVNYDPVSSLWYADVNVAVGSNLRGGPPPGWFLRLALVRFQPYSIPTAEISKTVLCSFCQPVPGRQIEVIGDTSDPSNQSVFVNVTGPAYFGWRPPTSADPFPDAYEPPTYQRDLENRYAPQPFSYGGSSTPSTSTMVVEVQVPIQVLDPGSPLTGELGWVSYQNVDPGYAPIVLSANFDFYAPGTPQNTVRWELTDPADPTTLQPIALPFPLDGATKMRLRISELDYFPYRDQAAPGEIGTTYRRPFVCHLPIN